MAIDTILALYMEINTIAMLNMAIDPISVLYMEVDTITPDSLHAVTAQRL